MRKLTILAAVLLFTGATAFAQNNRKKGTMNNTAQPNAKDTTLDRTRWDNPTTDDPNSMKTKPGVEMQMDNGTRQEQREFKNTVDTPGRRKTLPRRDQ